MKFNEENPDANLPVSLDTNLPDGYTQNQIDEIKTQGILYMVHITEAQKLCMKTQLLVHSLEYFLLG